MVPAPPLLTPQEANFQLIDLKAELFKDNLQYFTLFTAVHELQSLVLDLHRTVGELTRQNQELLRESAEKTREIKECQRQFAILERNVEGAIWHFQLIPLTQPSIATALKLAIEDHFGISHSELTHYGENKTPGRPRATFKSPRENLIESAQNWLVVLLRFVMHSTFYRIGQSFKWITTARFDEAGEIEREVLRSPAHPNARLFVELMRLARRHAEELSLDPAQVEHVRNRAALLEL